MKVNVLLTPQEVRVDLIRQGAVVVFDVLRATTTMTAALAAGVREIFIFDSLDAARDAARGHGDDRILCGEKACLPPPGFDLGNSPGAFDAKVHGGKTVFMATTNGTRAMVAARSAKLLLAGAIVNASAVANRLIAEGLDVTLLCAGTGGEPAMEDMIGAGAVLTALERQASIVLGSDVVRMAHSLFRDSEQDLKSVLTNCTGGQNVLAVGLERDIAFAARLDVQSVAGRVMDGPLRVVREN